MIGDPHVVLQHGARVGDVLLIDDAVGVAVDVGVVGDADPVAQDDAAAVVQQHVPVDHDVVAHFHVVAEGKLHVLERFEVLAHPGEDVRRQEPAEPDAEVHVLAPSGERSKQYQSQSSGLTRANRSASTSA